MACGGGEYDKCLDLEYQIKGIDLGSYFRKLLFLFF